MASSQKVNNNEASSKTLIIPKINSEKKQQELTDAIHHCFKLMLENGLAMSAISKTPSNLAKLIGQEMFFRIVKIIYDIQFNVDKDVVNPPRIKKEASSPPATTEEVIDLMQVKIEPSSPLMENSNSHVEDKEINYSQSVDDRQSTMEFLPIQEVAVRAAQLYPNQSIRTQEQNKEDASLAVPPAEEFINLITVKCEPQSPPPVLVEESSNYFEDSLENERQSKIDLVSAQGNVAVAQLQLKQSMSAQGQNVGEVPSTVDPVGKVKEENGGIKELYGRRALRQGKNKEEASLAMDFLTDESSDTSNDSDSSYSPSEDQKVQRTYVPLTTKEKMVRLTEEKPEWTIKSLGKVSKRLKNKKQLYSWKKQVKIGHTKTEKQHLTSKWVLDHAKKAQENSQPITKKQLHEWGVEAAGIYLLDGFKASDSWVTSLMKQIKGYSKKCEDEATTQ